MNENEKEFKREFNDSNKKTILSFLNSCINKYDLYIKGNFNNMINDKNNIFKDFIYCTKYNDLMIALGTKYWKKICLSKRFGTLLINLK